MGSSHSKSSPKNGITSPTHNPDGPDCHWDPIKVRTRGLGENLLYVTRRTYEVSDLNASLRFFHKILHFRIVELDETSATLDCKNMLLTIKVGTPVTYSGDNLIVNHLSVDVEDVEKAFDYLHRVDVSKGKSCSFDYR